uniref:Uncharacterized protein n=1 Tax=Lates calcarifer TaxID=8187 RepID=A0A4W6C934_LATCA
MCLVCIAFASWVLKTANPQVGDAWKAGIPFKTKITKGFHLITLAPLRQDEACVFIK